MKKYESVSIPEYLSVHSIVAVLRKNFGDAPTPIKSEYRDTHDFPEIFYSNDGMQEMLVGEVVYQLNAGDMIMYAPMLPHTRYRGTKSEVSIISFKADTSSLSSLYNKVISLTNEQRAVFENIISDGMAMYERRGEGSDVGGMVVKSGVTDYELQRLKKKLELFLVDVLGMLGGADSGKIKYRSREFEEVKSFLRANLGNNLSVKEIARGCSMSESKLKLLVREHTGTGPINYFLAMKIDEAKRMINEGGMNYTEISGRLGFSSLHYFSRLFKSRTGMSPSDYDSGRVK